MDTGTASKTNVEQDVAQIKAHMPETYKSIQARAAQVPGTFELVRRALRGEANCFYAIERGWVKGTPFTQPASIMPEVAAHMVQFGAAFLVVWPATEGEHGAN